MLAMYAVSPFVPLVTWPSTARIAETTNSIGVFGLPGPSPKASAQNSALPNIRSRTSAMSPSLDRNVSASLATRLCGGSSATKRCASFLETKCAVAGCSAR
jgi:hypothetical protein